MSKSLHLSKKDSLKSIRDAILIALGALAPQLLEIIEITDFGEYNLIISVICAMLTPLLNRFFRNKYK